MNGNIFKHFLLALLVLASQIMLFRHLRIFGAETDIILIYLFWLMTRQNRTVVLLFAAGLGLAQDALLDLWGMNMFAKVTIAMIGYHWIPKADENKLPLPRLMMLILFLTFTHNLILISLASFVQSMSATNMAVKVLLGNTVFTTFTASFIHFFQNES